MLNKYLNKIQNENVKEMISENVYNEQVADYSAVLEDLNKQVKILKKLKKDIASDENNPYVEELIEAIDAKIKQITVKAGK